jgi:hypothetical protein
MVSGIYWAVLEGIPLKVSGGGGEFKYDIADTL